MKKPVVLIGVGEIGGVFARGLLRLGHPVYPLTRTMDVNKATNEITDPEAVFVTVAENDLQAVLDGMPEVWRDRVILVQNELLPRDWLHHDLKNPTVISVWFEKKPGMDFKVLIPSPVFGPHAQLIADALGTLSIPANILNTADELEEQLLIKNVYILTTNIAGLETGGTVSELWSQHEHITRAVAKDVMAIQATLVGHDIDSDKLIQGMVIAFEGDPDHKCMGRSAPARLERALQQADAAGLTIPKLREIHAQA
jgi:ketopantoate reductase